MCALRTKLIVLQRFVKKYEKKRKGETKIPYFWGT